MGITGASGSIGHVPEAASWIGEAKGTTLLDRNRPSLEAVAARFPGEYWPGGPTSAFRRIDERVVDEVEVLIELARDPVNCGLAPDHANFHEMCRSFAARQVIRTPPGGRNTKPCREALLPEVANCVASATVQIHGGYGIMQEQPVAGSYVDAKILQIGEVQRTITARHLGC